MGSRVAELWAFHWGRQAPSAGAMEDGSLGHVACWHFPPTGVAPDFAVRDMLMCMVSSPPYWSWGVRGRGGSGGSSHCCGSQRGGHQPLWVGLSEEPRLQLKCILEGMVAALRT